MSFERTMVSQEYSYKYIARFFIFETCIVFTNIVRNSSFGYENHYWVRDVVLGTSLDGRKTAELKNGSHSLIIDDGKFIEVIKTLKLKTIQISNSAIFEMNDHDLVKLANISNEECNKKTRRTSFIMN